jgi:hypothetical protein
MNMKTTICNVIPPVKTALLLLLLVCCVSASAPPATLHQLLQQAQAPGKKQVVFCINPDDCVNCIYNFHQQFVRAQQSKSGNVHVIFKNRRAAERKKILAEEFRDIDSTRSHIYWNDALYADAVKQSKINHTSSIMLIYDAQGKQVFSKLVKEINGTEKEITALNN